MQLRKILEGIFFGEAFGHICNTFGHRWEVVLLVEGLLGLAHDEHGKSRCDRVVPRSQFQGALGMQEVNSAGWLRQERRWIG